MADGVAMRRLVGVCPQFNIMFDVLTVEEHLRIFAAIKGIPASDIDHEVRAPPCAQEILAYLRTAQKSWTWGRL